MSRTLKRVPYNMFRCPRGHRQAVLNDVRNKAIPPSSWEDIYHDKQADLIYRIISELYKKGYDRDEIIRRVRAKFGVGQNRAEHMIPPLDDISWGWRVR